VATVVTMEKKKDAAAPHVLCIADMVPRCHRMAAVRGGGHMRRYVTPCHHGPGCQRQPGEEELRPASLLFRMHVRLYGAPTPVDRDCGHG
jgi:hypothetical protein